MPSLTIRHLTTYRYQQPVGFGEHRMMLRPRDSRDQRVIEASLEISLSISIEMGPQICMQKGLCREFDDDCPDLCGTDKPRL
jgi:hypothetical protein